jgi:hypothetical protein
LYCVQATSSAFICCFRNTEDGLFYIDIMPLEEEEPMEQANSNIVPDEDDSSSGDDKGDTDGKDGDEDADKDNHDNIEEDDDHGDNKRQKLEPVDINCAHELCNHPGETKLREMARVFRWKLTGVLKTCSACAKAKATAKSIPKTTSEECKASKPGEVLHLDTTGPYKRTRGKNWYLV